ncbi:hypothetical protein FACS189430_09560 [Bacteroidia bacterium]|nr:hypothetical protein FACS189430_09560 [Bacteroidia bacterium]
MNEHHPLSILIALLFLCASSFAQGAPPAFATLGLERIYADLPKECKASGGECRLAAVRHPVYFRHNGRNEISQIGFRLFPEQFAAAYSPEILDFLERVSLELFLMPNNRRVEAKLKEYRMTWLYKGASIGNGFFRSFGDCLAAITDTSAFRLHKDSTMYAAQWSHPHLGTIQATFPAQYTVISGKDNKELGDELSALLLAYQSQGTTALPPAEAQSAASGLTPYNGAVYVKRGRNFIIPAINSDVYYQKTEDKAYRLLYSKRYPHESLANMFVAADAAAGKEVILDVTHRKYGYSEQKYRMKLSDFTAFFGDDFETYVGFEMAGHPEIKALVILYNRHFNFVNMLIVDTFEDVFFEKDGVIPCRMYAFIPSHNIRSLFGDDSNMKSKDSKEYEPVLLESIE